MRFSLPKGARVGLTYFKRFRMELDLTTPIASVRPTPASYELVGFRDELLREHATAKYQSFHHELDANVFPCLGRRDGCLRLMREITSRTAFVPEATWLMRYRDGSGKLKPIGTVQGLQVDDWGSIQNLGVHSEHRGKGLGSILLLQAAYGFASVGLKKMHLEVTTENTAAVRLYQRLGFKSTKVVYKAANVAGA